MLQTLINKSDNFELIRIQIASLLVAEVNNQKSLAAVASLNPDDWDLRIYLESSNPWEIWLNDQTNTTPVVNISFDTSSIDGLAGNVQQKQQTNGTFNIDCYAIGVSSDIPLSGHNLGDATASIQVQRTIRLVRNILMAGENTYLQMRGIVGSRKISSITAFQPESNNVSVQKVAAARIQFQVLFNEFVNDYVPETLDYIAIDIFAAEDGQLMLEADYQYPL